MAAVQESRRVKNAVKERCSKNRIFAPGGDVFVFPLRVCLIIMTVSLRKSLKKRIWWTKNRKAKAETGPLCARTTKSVVLITRCGGHFGKRLILQDLWIREKQSSKSGPDNIMVEETRQAHNGFFICLYTNMLKHIKKSLYFYDL